MGRSVLHGGSRPKLSKPFLVPARSCDSWGRRVWPSGPTHCWRPSRVFVAGFCGSRSGAFVPSQTTAAGPARWGRLGGLHTADPSLRGLPGERGLSNRLVLCPASLSSGRLQRCGRSLRAGSCRVCRLARGSLPPLASLPRGLVLSGRRPGDLQRVAPRPVPRAHFSAPHRQRPPQANPIRRGPAAA